MRIFIETAGRKMRCAAESYPVRMGAVDASAIRPDAGAQDLPTSARVLVVEDEPGIVDFVRRGLEAEGFQVAAALDGVEGERMALAGGIDAVVLDLMLPGRSGLEILASLRRASP